MTLLSVPEYMSQHDYKYPDYLYSLGKGSILSGLFAWEPEEAHCWAGPFTGGMVFASIGDWSKGERSMILYPEKEHRAWHSKYEQIWIPDRLRGFQKLKHSEESILAEMTDTEIAKYTVGKKMRELRFLETIKGTVHIEKPVCLRLCGNDDCSYSHTYATEAEALRDLNLLIETPLWEYMQEMGFQFTN